MGAADHQRQRLQDPGQLPPAALAPGVTENVTTLPNGLLLVAMGQNHVPGTLGPGLSTQQWRSPMTGALPDLWVPAGYDWCVTFEGITDRDVLSEFYAVVEQAV